MLDWKVPGPFASSRQPVSVAALLPVRPSPFVRLLFTLDTFLVRDASASGNVRIPVGERLALLD